MDAWRHPGLPHIRLDFTVVDAEAIHYFSAMRKAQDTAPAAAQAEKTKENKFGKVKGGVGVTGIAMQLSGRFGTGLDAFLRRLVRGTRGRPPRQRGETVGDHYRSGGTA